MRRKLVACVNHWLAACLLLLGGDQSTVRPFEPEVVNHCTAHSGLSVGVARRRAFPFWVVGGGPSHRACPRSVPADASACPAAPSCPRPGPSLAPSLATAAAFSLAPRVCCAPGRLDGSGRSSGKSHRLRPSLLSFAAAASPSAPRQTGRQAGEQASSESLAHGWSPSARLGSARRANAPSSPAGKKAATWRSPRVIAGAAPGTHRQLPAGLLSAQEPVQAATAGASCSCCPLEPRPRKAAALPDSDGGNFGPLLCPRSKEPRGEPSRHDGRQHCWAGGLLRRLLSRPRRAPWRPSSPAAGRPPGATRLARPTRPAFCPPCFSRRVASLRRRRGLR